MIRNTFSAWNRLGGLIMLAPAVVLLLAVGCERSAPEAEPPASEQVDQAAIEEQLISFEQRFGRLVDGQLDADRLLAEMAEFVERHPDVYEGRRLYAQALQVERKSEQAYEQFEAAVQLSPDDAELRLLVGDSAMQMGRYEQAQRHYSRGADLEPDNERFRIRLAQALTEQQRYDEARRLLLESLRRDSSQHTAHLGLSDLYARQNRQDMALEHIERAIELVPEADVRRQVIYVLRQAALLRRANRPEDALAVLRGLPAEQQLQFGVAQAMAQCWVMLGQPERAAEHFDYLLSLDPSDDLAAAEAANWHLRAGQFDEARQRIEVLRRINPRSPALRPLENSLSTATEEPELEG